MNEKLISRIKNLFVNREDAYARQFLQKNGKKGFVCVKMPQSNELIKKHLEGGDSIGQYQLNKENNLNWICFDYDENTKEDFEKAKTMFNFLKEKGFNPLMEKSGGGDFKVHIWLFLMKPQPAKVAQIFMKRIQKGAGVEAHECFPKQSTIAEFGNLVKMPLGLHLVTNKFSKFLNNDFEEIDNEKELLKKVEYHFDNRDVLPVFKEEELDLDPKEKKEVVENPSEFDNFFNYVLNNELPAGSSKDAPGKLVGINDNVLKNMAIWFLQKGYTLEKLTKEIKPMYDKKNWVFGDLKGWFKKAQKGDISEISKGEIINWCKAYQPSLLHLINFKRYLEPSDIKFQTDHLPSFEEIENLIPLRGETYKGIKKIAYDQIISLAIPKENFIIRVGDILTDTRFHICCVMPSGKGKMEVKEGIKKALLSFNPNANVKEPRTLHKEQLIGKIIKRNEKGEDGKKKEIYHKKLGYMNSDLLIIEEAHEIFNSTEKNDVDCRDILTVGMDIYEKNLIQKQNIDNLDTEEETIEYYSKTNVLAFTQPLHLKEAFSTKGLQRRFQIDYKEFPERTSVDHFVSRLNKRSEDERSAIKIATLMRKINQLKGEWKLEPEAIEPFIFYHKIILEQGFQMGGKAKNFTKIMEFPMQNNLLKISALRAAANLRMNITKEDVENAFMDILERFVFELDFVEKMIKGQLDYGANWGGAVGKKQECLEWLQKQGATSKEDSPINIGSFQIMISKLFDISLRRARARYAEMKKEGLVSDWLGQGRDNKVWLNFKPKEKSVLPENTLSPKEEYLKIVLGRSDMSRRSGRTPKTQRTRINPSKELDYIYPPKVSDLSVLPDISVLPVLPEKKEDFS